MTPILNKYTLIMSNSTVAEDNLRLIEKYQVEAWFLSTGTLATYTHEPNLHLYNISSLKHVYTGGELVLSSVAKAFVKTVLRGRLDLDVIYGNTEGGFLAVLRSQDQTEGIQIGACGKVCPGVEMKIVNEDGSLVPPGCLGALWIKSISRMTGYWGKPELTSQLFDEEYFYETGDAAFFDKDGYLYLRGRIGDLINYKGNKVPSAEVEDILMSHPAVKDVVVVARDHPTDGQHATAFVVRKPGWETLEQDIISFVQDRVEEMKQLRGGVHFMESLPRVAVGKVTRKALR